MRAHEFVIERPNVDEGWKDAAMAGVLGLASLGAQAKAPTSVQQIVKPGETVYSIARQHHINPVEILKLNRMNKDTKLTVGQSVTIPKAPTKAVSAPAATSSSKPTVATTPATTGDKKVADIKKQVNAPSNIATNGLSTNSGPEHLVQREAIKAGLKGAELAQFMAQTRHESADFSRMKEMGGSKYFHMRYDPKTSPKTAKILGNKHAGDGIKFHGRGFIQITGRDNYRMAGEALGLPLEQKPDLAATPEIAAKIAVWYWNTRVKPFISNFADTASVTKKINPALRGLADRKEHFADYKNIIATK